MLANYAKNERVKNMEGKIIYWYLKVHKIQEIKYWLFSSVLKSKY